MKKGFVKTLSKSAADIRLFPLKNVLRRYDKHNLGCDLKAGAGVAMLSFSMSIAYAMIAGLPIKYGLFGCIAAAAVSGVFSSSRFIMFGPSNASAVMLMSAFASLGLVTEEQRAGAAAAMATAAIHARAVPRIPRKRRGLIRFRSSRRRKGRKRRTTTERRAVLSGLPWHVLLRRARRC